MKETKERIWDLSDTLGLLGKNKPHVVKGMQEISVGGVILVIGSAVPANIHTLELYFPMADKIVIIDTCYDSLLEHKNYCTKYGHYLANMDAQELAILDTSVDLIICDYTLNLMNSPEFFLGNAFRCLKKEGKFLLMLGVHPEVRQFVLEKAIRRTSVFKKLSFWIRFCALFNRTLILDNSVDYNEVQMKLDSWYDNLKVVVQTWSSYQEMLKHSRFCFHELLRLRPFAVKEHFCIMESFGLNVIFQSSLLLLKKMSGNH